MKCAVVLCVILAGCALVQCQVKREASGLEEIFDKTDAGTFPPPTPAAPPSTVPDSESPSARDFVIGDADGWTIKEYKDIKDAKVGDSVVFRWVGSHTVWVLVDKECTFDQGTGNEVSSSDTELARSDNSLGFNPPTFIEFKYTLTEPGTFHFADSTSNNCQQGMLFSVDVAP